MVTSSCPTSRWHPLRRHDVQRAFWDSPARFNVVPAGRRSGKTELAKRRAIRKALNPSPYADFRVVFAAPTWMQAKRLFCRDVKAMIPRWAYAGQDPRRAVSESELSIRLATGAEIVVAGLDRPERVEGSPIDHVVIDEYGNCRESVWGEHVRPCLSERNGSADLIGCPEGRNHFWRMATTAQEQQVERPDLWGFFAWPSVDILPPEEIAIAKAELDARTFSQEYEASFLDISGRVYYSFQREIHAAERLPYDPKSPLFVGFDFNVSPGVAVFVQEREYTGDNPRALYGSTIAAVVDEIWIGQDSNTPRICQEIIRRYSGHESTIELHGDASGGSRHTSQVDGSDWDLVRKHLVPVFGERIGSRDQLRWRVPYTNPAVRARINSLNSKLESADGMVHLLVDPGCKHVIRDLEGVTWNNDGTDADKKTAPMLTHISDALGYLVHERWPLAERLTVISQF